MLWSYILAVVGLGGFWLAGKKVWWAWYINVAAQALWATYAVVTDQYGFLLGAAVYTVVFTKNAVAWTKDRHIINPERPDTFKVRRWNYPESTPMRLMRGPYSCDFCDAGEYEWCKDTCTAMDPYDWR